MRKRELTDEPSLTPREAAALCNMAKDNFKLRWEEYYKHKIRHVQTMSGLKINLFDLMKHVFPKVRRNADIGQMCLTFLGQLAAARKQRRSGTKKRENGGVRAS